MLFFLEDDPDYNLPERMMADVRNTLAQHRDVFEVRAARACWQARAGAAANVRSLRCSS